MYNWMTTPSHKCAHYSKRWQARAGQLRTESVPVDYRYFFVFPDVAPTMKEECTERSCETFCYMPSEELERAEK